MTPTDRRTPMTPAQRRQTLMGAWLEAIARAGSLHDEGRHAKAHETVALADRLSEVHRKVRP